jgi:hypothetical protein
MLAAAEVIYQIIKMLKGFSSVLNQFYIFVTVKNNQYKKTHEKNEV